MRSTGLVGLISFVSVVLNEAATLVTNSNAFRPNIAGWIDFQAESETGISNTRFLRTRSVAENEERAGLSVPIVDKVKTVLSSSKVPVTPEQLQKWLNKDKSADAVFTRLHLHQAGKRLFSNPQFATWLQYADDLSAKHPTKEIPAIGTLIRQYDDSTLYKMIEVAKMAPTTKELATKLQAEQMQHWVSTTKSADEVFRLFKLDKAGKAIFSNPEFVTWTKYVDDLNAKHPEEPMSMVPTLAKYFNDDDIMFKMIETAKGVEETKSTATKVETEWLGSWLQSRKTPFNALNDLKLANSADTLLESPRFSTWVKYFDDFNKNYPHQKTTMIETLTQTFGDVSLSRMIHAAQANDATKAIATKLESAQQKMWLNSEKSIDDVFKLLLQTNVQTNGKKSTYDVFAQLKIYKHDNGFRNNPLFDTWISYINFFITENPDKMAAVISGLENHFSGRPLNIILEETKKFPSMKNAADKIQADKMKNYLTKNKSPPDVFVRLGLDDVGYDVLSTPLFKSWMNYIDLFNKKNPGQQETVLFALRSRYEWSGVDKMIDRALQNPSTEEIGRMVEKLWLRQWLNWEKHPKDAFHYLHLNQAGDKALADPKFQTWVKYLDDFNQRYPAQKTTMIDGLRANYNDINLLTMLNTAKNDPITKNLVSDLENALINKWVVEKKTPAFLYNQLGHLRYSNDILLRYQEKLKKI